MLWNLLHRDGSFCNEVVKSVAKKQDVLVQIMPASFFKHFFGLRENQYDSRHEVSPKTNAHEWDTVDDISNERVFHNVQWKERT